MTVESRRSTLWDVLRADQEDQVEEARLIQTHTPLHHRHDQHVHPYCTTCRVEDQHGYKSRRLAAQATRQQQEAEEEQLLAQWSREDYALPPNPVDEQ